MFKVGDEVRLKDSVTFEDYCAVWIDSKNTFVRHKKSVAKITGVRDKAVTVRFSVDPKNSWWLKSNMIEKANKPFEDFIRSMYGKV